MCQPSDSSTCSSKAIGFSIVSQIFSIEKISIFRFFYGYEVSDLDLSELYETYVAADKYQVNDLTDLSEYVKTTLDASNCCLVYDQLLKLPNENVLKLNYVKRMIQLHAKKAFKSESFTKIHLKTLVSILELHHLNIDEIDILKTCLRWTEIECARRGMVAISENTREIFEPIKHLINFQSLRVEQLHNIEFKRLLSDDEITSLLNKSKERKIECRPFREPWKLYAVQDSGESYFSLYKVAHSCAPWLDTCPRGMYGNSEQLSKISFRLKVNHPVWIESIYTHLPTNIKRLRLSIYENDEKVDLETTLDGPKTTRRWNFRFEKCLQIEPNQDYKLKFEFQKFTFDDSSYKLSKKTELRLNDDMDDMRTKFEVDLRKYHCIHKIEFYSIPYQSPQ